MQHINENRHCIPCNKSFRDSFNLRRHTTKCHGPKKEGDLRSASSSLNANNPFKCEYCSKEFPSQHVLKYHVQTHLGKKETKGKKANYGRFQCIIDNCGKAFTRADNLKRHIERMHGAGTENKVQNQSQSQSQPQNQNLNQTQNQNQSQNQDQSQSHSQLHVQNQNQNNLETMVSEFSELGPSLSFPPQSYLVAGSNTAPETHCQSSSKTYKCLHQNCLETFDTVAALRCHIITHFDSEQTLGTQYMQQQFLPQQLPLQLPLAIPIPIPISQPQPQPLLQCPNPKPSVAMTVAKKKGKKRLQKINRRKDRDRPRSFHCIVDQCGKAFTRADNLKRHIERKHGDLLGKDDEADNNVNSVPCNPVTVPQSVPQVGEMPSVADLAYAYAFATPSSSLVEETHNDSKEFKYTGPILNQMGCHDAGLSHGQSHGQVAMNFCNTSMSSSSSSSATPALSLGNRRPSNSDSMKVLKCPHPNCTEIFNAKKNLISHMIAHSDSRPFKCPQQDCLKAFMNQGQLTRHLKRPDSHSKTSLERTFLCKVEDCGKAFTRADNLKRHTERKHGDSRAGRTFPNVHLT